MKGITYDCPILSIGTFQDGGSTFPGLVIDEAVYNISTVLPGIV